MKVEHKSSPHTFFRSAALLGYHLAQPCAELRIASQQRQGDGGDGRRSLARATPAPPGRRHPCLLRPRKARAVCSIRKADWRLGGGVHSEQNLRSLCGAGRVAEVMDVLETEEGMSASKKLYAEVMCKCGQMQALSEAKRLHIHLARRRLEKDSYLGSGIVDMYVKCGSLVDARQVHDGLPLRNEYSWTALILGYANCGQARQALRTYEEMRDEGVEPSTYTLVHALKACSSLGDLESGNDIHVHVVESGNDSDVYVGTMLVDMYAKCGSMADAWDVFHKLQHRDVVSWTSMILGYAEKQRGELALRLYAQMQQEGVAPNVRTFVGALKACSSLVPTQEGKKVVQTQCLEKGRSIHSRILNCGFQSNVYVGTTLVDMYAKCGSMEDARRVFDTLPHRNVVSWNAMILGYADQGESEEAFRLFAQMHEQGLSANGVTFVSVLKACGNCAALARGREVHAQICSAGLELSDIMVATALIDMYGKCGSMVNAQQVFDKVSSTNLVTWNALISGYARQGDSELVFRLFERMREESIQPDGVTLLSVLTVCSHVGLVAKGHMLFDAMSEDFGIAQTIEHFTCMVDLLGRAGQVEEALGMAENMPFQPNLVVWRTILGACRKWNHVDIGRHAFHRAVKLDETHAAAYALMSNIYAEAHVWDGRDMVQAMRMKASAWKSPGQSWWTDLQGMVHKFVVGDTKHPQRKGISAKLKHLLVKMKEQGYAPNLDSVVWDVPDGEKEDTLCGHSEKLAIAWAMMNTPPGTPIHIAKNLRVCDDCHKATALISKIERRDIICRDANRFHNYKDGKCSCGDYW